MKNSTALHGTVIQGNFIGTDITGTLARGNYVGIDIEAVSSSLIGTDGQDGAADALEGNLISGNLTEGIKINAASEYVSGQQDLPGASNNVIAGNLIGTNATGTAALANGDDGVQLEGGTTGNSVGVNSVYGAADTDERNIISGNTSFGIYITGTGTTGNVVQGNYIGTNALGSAALGNLYGIVIDGNPSGNTIGGITATPGKGAGNLISGNRVHGLQISDGATDNLVAGNLIGLNAAATAPLPNAYQGIEVFSAGAGNTIGGTAVGASNVIAGNSSYGIELAGPARRSSKATPSAPTSPMQRAWATSWALGSSDRVRTRSAGQPPRPQRHLGQQRLWHRPARRQQLLRHYRPSNQNVIEGDYIGLAANGTPRSPTPPTA